MEKLKAVLLICALCSLTGCFIFDECFAATDCGNSDEKLPAYANKSGETIKIIAIVGGYPYEKLIANGDTLHYAEEEWYRSIPADIGYSSCTSIVFFGSCNMPTRMELHFLGDPQKCLIFDGPIEHDGIDMRSWNSYEKGNEIPDWTDWVTSVEYVYTITPEHREMAREEDCQDSAGTERRLSANL
ncbi:MAG: hypothetical protein LBH25_14000 [Fibromonadaceae bacterium]|jgi:hypothetical protein|nr:hypothetical protein [Fibromonadaceae bacterium]